MQDSDIERFFDARVVDRGGHDIGTVTELYVDEVHGRVGWLAVRTGLFGEHVSPVPLADIRWSDDGAVVLPFDRGTVKDAPHHDPEMALSVEEEAALFDYYGVGYEARHATTVTTAGDEPPSTFDHTTEDAERGDAAGLHVGAAGLTRLRTFRRGLPPEAHTVDTVEATTYPDDDVAQALQRSQQATEDAARARHREGL